MARPQAGTKEGDAASARWREAMLERCGGEEGLHRWAQEMGRKGGRASKKGGFASDRIGSDGYTGPERARIVGALGGLKSTRKGVKNHEGKKWKKLHSSTPSA